MRRFTFPTRCALVGAAAILTAISVFASLWNFLGGEYTWHSEAPISPCYAATYAAFLSVLLAIPPALWLVKVAESPHIQAAAVYTLLNWGSALSDLLRQVASCQPPSFFLYPSSNTERRLLKRPGFFFMLFVASFGFFLAITRLQELERTSLRGFATRLQRKILWVASIAFFFLLVAFSVIQMMLVNHPVAIGLLRSSLGFVYILMVLGYLLTVFGFCRGFRAAQAAQKAAGPRLALWARSVQRAFAWQILAILMMVFTTLPSSVVRMPASGHTRYGVGEIGLDRLAVVTLVDSVANNLWALLVSGVFSGAAEGTAKRAGLVRARRQRREKSTQRWLDRRDGLGEEDREWEAEVIELARRGISISALLHFYKVELPRWMPNFQSSQHTTGDVTRFAIIPLSESQQCAAVDILMAGAPARAAKMVTHAWSNHFRDLVASILADAFNEGEYWLWAELLDRDFACVEKWVEMAGVGEEAYWICAFAVNQHASICHVQRVDSVTGQVFPGCPCLLPKVLNDTPPLLTDGRSIPCQLNKFDDMIRFLAATGKFAQIVAVDRKFATFTRSWCIAELATSHEIGLSQRLTILSKGNLEEHEETMQRLRIQDMYATRSEDKDLILASIADHDAFNATVQKMIFEDLLPRWNSLDAKERMESAGHLIRWGSSPVWGADEVATAQVAAPANTSSTRSPAVRASL